MLHLEEKAAATVSIISHCRVLSVMPLELQALTRSGQRSSFDCHDTVPVAMCHLRLVTGSQTVSQPRPLTDHLASDFTPK